MLPLLLPPQEILSQDKKLYHFFSFMNITEYGIALQNYLGTSEFSRLTDSEQQQRIKVIRNTYLGENPEADVSLVDSTTEELNKRFLRGTGKGRAIPEIDPSVLPVTEEWNSLSKDERQEKIDEFRLRIPEIAAANPTQKEDTEFFLNQQARELERRNNGEGRNWVVDKFSRAGEGAFAGLLNYVGADEMAEKAKDYFHENPEYDEAFTAQLAQGLGDVGASMSIFLGSAFITRGLGGSAATAGRVGTISSLGTNSIMRYNEAYNNAIASGLDDALANKAGINAIPAAAIDVLGDRIIGSQFLPKEVNKIFSTGTTSEKRKLLDQLINDSTAKSKLFDISKNAISEGITEVVGDHMASYGPYLVTGIDDYIPTDEEVNRSFLLGAVIGGGIAGAAQIPNFVGNKKGTPQATQTKNSEQTITLEYSTVEEKRLSETQRNLDKIDSESQQQIFDLLGQGQYKQALDLSNKMLTPVSPVPQSTTITPPPTDQKSDITSEDSVSESVPQQTTTFDFSTPGTPANQQIYQDLTDSVFLDSNLFSGKEITPEIVTQAEERNERINRSVPDRNRVSDQIDSIVANTQIEPAQAQSVKTLIDTVAARWLSSNPESNLNDFYNRLNFETAESIYSIDKVAQQFTSKVKDPKRNRTLVGGVVQPDRSIATPRADVNTLLDGMIGMFRSTGIMEEILTPEEMSDLRQSLGVDQDFTASNDSDLAQRFRGYIESGQNDNPVFNKLKQWIQDIYKNFRNLFLPDQRNNDLDKQFESLFQINLSAGEFANKTSPGQSTLKEITEPSIAISVTQAPSETLNEAEQNYNESKDILKKSLGAIPQVDVPFDADPQQESGTMVEYLTNILDGVSREGFPVVQRMIADLIAKNPDVKLEINPNYFADGSYTLSENKITLRNLSLKTIGHEVAHALTQNDISRYIDNRQGSYETKLNDAFNSSKTPQHIKTLIDVYRTTADILGFSEHIGRPITVDQNASLPRSLSSASPRYSYGSKQFTLQFASDLQKAAYIIAQTKPSKRDADYLSFVRKSTGYSESQAREYGRRVRAGIKELAQTSEAGQLQVPNTPAIIAIPPNAYRFTNLHEFVASAMTQQSFQNELADISYQGSTIWETIAETIANALNWIRSIAVPEMTLRSDGDNALVATLASVNEIINTELSGTQESDITFSPLQTDNQKKVNSFKRLEAIRKGRLNDKTDIGTIRLSNLIGSIRSSDLHRLGRIDPEAQELAFRLIDNIYESRKNAVPSPQMRMELDQILGQVQALKDMIDLDWIRHAIKTYDGLIDWSGIDLNDRDAVAQTINDYEKRSAIQDEGKRQDSLDKRKAALQRKYQTYRNESKNIREIIRDRFVNSSNYLNEYEAIHGQIDVPELRALVGTHFDYLMNVDIDSVEGISLYKHFYALNHIIDGSVGYLDLTIAHVANERNKASNIQSLQGMFRDPMLNKGKLINALDKINMKAENLNTQELRYSRMEEARAFLDTDLIGELKNILMGVANNNINEKTEALIQAEEQFEKDTGRRMGQEDDILSAMVVRLLQYEVGADPDVALKRSIENEKTSIENKIRVANEADAAFYRTKHIPLLESLTEGLDQIESGSMQHFVDTLQTRLVGSYDLQTGQARMKFIQSYIDLFDSFGSSSRIISEGLYNQPFKEQTYYTANTVFSDSSKPNNDQGSLTDPFDLQEQDYFNPGMKSKASHLNERVNKLRPDQYYSYNVRTLADRNIRRISIDNATAAERFIISKRLEKGSELNKIISDSDVENHHRVQGLRDLANKMRMNAISRGEPQGVLLGTLQRAVNAFARTSLSGLHHIVSQPAAAFSDYLVRTGNYSGWIESAGYYARNQDKVKEWFDENIQWVGRRGALSSMVLDTRAVRPEPEGIRDSELVRNLSKIYDKAGDVITTSIRMGDRFSNYVTTLAEYARLKRLKGEVFNSLEEMDWNTVDGRLLAQAARNVEKNINTSDKAFRGDLFSDRRQSTTALRNVFFAFAHHTTNLATQLNLALRDIIELYSTGASSDQIVPKIRTIGGILAQTITFTSSRYLFNGMMAMGMIKLIQELFDDEEDKIAELQEKVWIEQRNGDPVKTAQARQELDNAKNVRAVVDRMRQQSLAPGSFFKSVIRDSMGSFHLGFSNGVVSDVFFWPTDTFARHMTEEASKEITRDYRNQIDQAKEEGDLKRAAKLEQNLNTFSNQSYIPLAFNSGGGFDIGGIYGGFLTNTHRNLDNIYKGMIGAQEMSMNDLIVTAQIIGLSQADLRKTLNAIDRVEDRQWRTNKYYSEDRIPRAELQEQKKRDAEVERTLRSFFR